MEVYVDASKFAGGCVIRQFQDGKWVPLLYDSFLFNPAERNCDTYKRELRVMVTMCEKHHHILRGAETSSVYTDHKPLTTFLTSERHSDIFYRFYEKLRPLNIVIKHIEGARNAVADGLSRTIFPEDCSKSQTTHELLLETQAHDAEGKREWFWKSGKGGYAEMLKERA